MHIKYAENGIWLGCPGNGGILAAVNAIAACGIEPGLSGVRQQWFEILTGKVGVPGGTAVGAAPQGNIWPSLVTGIAVTGEQQVRGGTDKGMKGGDLTCLLPVGAGIIRTIERAIDIGIISLEIMTSDHALHPTPAGTPTLLLEGRG